jgi:hypothetical protein
MSVSLFGKDAITGSNDPVSISNNNLHVAQYIWDTNTLAWIKQTGSSGAVGADVTVTNFPATQPISGSVSVSNLPATQPVSGSILVSNFPATQAVSGSVSVSNFPATQVVSGTVAATQSGTWTIANTSFQATQSGTWIITTKNALTSNSPTAVSVGVTSSQILAANANRKGLILVNTSSANISLGLGTTAVLNSGITLYPGGAFNMDEYCFTTAAINAIASVAASNIGIQEWQ